MLNAKWLLCVPRTAHSNLLCTAFFFSSYTSGLSIFDLVVLRGVKPWYRPRLARPPVQMGEVYLEPLRALFSLSRYRLNRLSLLCSSLTSCSSPRQCCEQPFSDLSFCVLASEVHTNQVCWREATLVILGSRQVCFARAPAPASAYADLTARAGPAAPAAVATADPDAVAAAAAGADHYSASVTPASDAATALVSASFLTAAFKGFEWVKLGSRLVCFGFGLIIFMPRQLPSDDAASRGKKNYQKPADTIKILNIIYTYLPKYVF